MLELKSDDWKSVFLCACFWHIPRYNKCKYKEKRSKRVTVMRRKDREITDFDEIMKIIAKCDTCRLALFDEEFPYIVPLNFGTDVENGELYLYFHGANVGTKLDLRVSGGNSR